MIEPPLLLPVPQNLRGTAARSSRCQEVLLVGRLVIGVTGREHHAFDAQFHHLVEKLRGRFGIGAVKQRRVRRDAEAALHRFRIAFDRVVVVPSRQTAKS